MVRTLVRRVLRLVPLLALVSCATARAPARRTTTPPTPERPPKAPLAVSVQTKRKLSDRELCFAIVRYSAGHAQPVDGPNAPLIIDVAVFAPGQGPSQPSDVPLAARRAVPARSAEILPYPAGHPAIHCSYSVPVTFDRAGGWLAEFRILNAEGRKTTILVPLHVRATN